MSTPEPPLSPLQRGQPAPSQPSASTPPTDSPTVYLPRQRSVSTTELERRWLSVRARLQVIFQSMGDNPVRTHPEAWVSLYTDVAKLFSHNDDIRKGFMYIQVRNFICHLVEAQLDQLRALSGPALLAEYNRRWRMAFTFIHFMKRVLYPLHSFWIKHNAHTLKDNPIRPIDKLLMFYWRDNLLTHLHSLIDVALTLVDQERRGMSIDRSLIVGLVEHLLILGTADVCKPPRSPRSPTQGYSSPSPQAGYGQFCHSTTYLYNQLFEEPFLAATVAFYKSHGSERISPDTVASFMVRILARLEREEERARHILHPESVARVRKAAEEQLIGNQIEYLHNESCEMIRNGDYKNLNIVYTLLKRVDGGLTPVRAFFVRYVRTEGNSVLVNHVTALSGKDDLRAHLVLIEKLMQLYFKYAAVVRRCFEGSSMLLMAIDDAFRGFVNRSVGSISVPTLLAHYIDHLMRSKDTSGPNLLCSDGKDAGVSKSGGEEETNGVGGGDDDGVVVGVGNIQQTTHKRDGDSSDGKDKGEEEMDYLSELVRFFMYLDDKDVFCETHRRLFAKRLLSPSCDEDLESRFVTRLEAQMGGIYTQRFRGMLQDLKVSSTLRLGYATFVNERLTRVSLSQAAKQEDESNVDGKDQVVGKTSKVAESSILMDTFKSIEAQWTRLRGDRLRSLPASGSAEDAVESTDDKDAPSAGGEKDGSSGSEKECDDTKADGSSVEKAKEEDIVAEDDDLTREALLLSMSVHVLNALHWPSTTPLSMNVSPVVVRCQLLFREFYMQDRQSRKLTWAHGMASMTVRATFGGEDFSLVTSTCQACVLMLFNDAGELEIGDIARRLDVDVEELWQQMRPLLFARKSRVLRVAGGKDCATRRERGRKRMRSAVEDGGEDEDGDNGEKGDDGEGGSKAWAGCKIQVNESFTSAKVRIVVPRCTVAMTSVEAASSNRHVVVDRSTQVDAAIVRLMKAKKQTTHVELCGEVLAMVSNLFVADPRLIKTRIERLIDMEYMTRDTADNRVYRYCA